MKRSQMPCAVLSIENNLHWVLDVAFQGLPAAAQVWTRTRPGKAHRVIAIADRRKYTADSDAGSSLPFAGDTGLSSSLAPGLNADNAVRYQAEVLGSMVLAQATIS